MTLLEKLLTLNKKQKVNVSCKREDEWWWTEYRNKTAYSVLTNKSSMGKSLLQKQVIDVYSVDSSILQIDIDYES